MDPDHVAGTAIAAIFTAVLITALIIGPILYVITSWFMMRIFDKAGVQGRWRAWVPIYNSLIFVKLGDVSPWIALGAMALSAVPFLNAITSFAVAAVFAMAAYRVGQKLQKEGAWVVLWIFLAPVWLGINAFDRSRWNTAVGPPPWAGQDWLCDRTVWDGVPVQAAEPPATHGEYGAYGSPPPAHGAASSAEPPSTPFTPPPPYGSPSAPGEPGEPRG